MGAGQCVRDLGQDRARLVDRRPDISREQLAEAPAGHERHDEEDQAIALVDRVDGDDVGMAQLRGRLRLTEEA